MALFSPRVDTRELAYYPNISRLLQAFRYDFQVTWFSTERSHGTEFQFVLLKPQETIKETFGLKSEIPVFFLRFRELQPRTAQAIEAVCRESRFAGRIDATVALLCSPHDSVREWCAEYVSQNIQSRVLIALTERALEAAIDDRWGVINQLKNQFFIRDFFNYKQPIQSDTFFYGREVTVNSILDDIKKVQNAGLFGLRKTGKTTVLLRVERLFKRANLGVVVKVDCQNRPIRKSDADGIATRIIRAIDSAYGRKYAEQVPLASDIMEVLREAIGSVPKKHRVCIIFDEVEYVTPLSPTDLQWNTEYLDLFQSLRSIQTDTQKLCVVVCGVNPTICDADRFKSQVLPDRTVQNPLFGIVNVQYLRGFDVDTFKKMAEFFGRRMGLQFSNDALDYIWNRYGGHPLLSRLACSFHHTQLLDASVNRPIRLDKSTVQLADDDRDAELSSYCEHVLSELREFYGKEYAIVEAIAFDDPPLLQSLSSDLNAMRHLRAYGLIDEPEGRDPVIRMPVVVRYLKNKKASESGRGHWRNVVSSNERSAWLARRRHAIIEDLEILNDELRATGARTLFDGGSPRKASDFLSINVVDGESDCIDFLVRASKVVTENIEKHYKSQGASYFKEFSLEYPALFDAATRIRIYRHFFAHIELDPPAQARLSAYRSRDFDGKHPKDIADGWFQVQQISLDNLHAAIQRELTRV